MQLIVYNKTKDVYILRGRTCNLISTVYKKDESVGEKHTGFEMTEWKQLFNQICR